MLPMKVGASITEIRLMLLHHASNEGRASITAIRLMLLHHAFNEGRG